LLFEETFTASIFLKRRKKGTLRTGRRREHNINAIKHKLDVLLRFLFTNSLNFKHLQREEYSVCLKASRC
jgi:hypothetical protein